MGKLILVLRSLWMTCRRKYLVLEREDLSFGAPEKGRNIDVGMMTSK